MDTNFTLQLLVQLRVQLRSSVLFPVGVVEELRMESRLQSLVPTPEYISSDRKSLKTIKQKKTRTFREFSQGSTQQIDRVLG